MARPNDETLMAYADDALDAAERARVAAYLETDAEARAVVAMFAATRRLAGQAFELPGDAPLPAGLAERILMSPLPRGPADAAGAGGGSGKVVDNVVDMAGRRRLATADRSVLRPALIAATLALAVGLAGGWMISRQATFGSPADQIALGAVPPASPLADLLERRPSGVPQGRLAVVATFRDRLDRVCREIEVLAPEADGGPQAAGVACREPGGSWSIEGAARLARAPEATAPGYQPSGASDRDALQSLLSTLGAKRSLDAGEERELLSRGWR